jgi:hypothetical protein
MNERIKQLAKEAGFNLPNNLVEGVNGPGVVTEKDKLTKFAELLVRECAEVGLDSVEDGDDLDAIMKRVHNNILKHFGVAE